MNLYLNIEASTWPRDSHGLYDYDSTTYETHLLKVNNSGCILRKESNIYYDYQSSSPSENKLINVIGNNDEYIIHSVKEENLGIVVKYMKEKGHKLREGDIIKLGKVLLKVKGMSQAIQGVKENYDECEGSNNSDITCRICFRTHNNAVDPLLSICDCSGSMAFTHFKCLQK